MSETPRTDAEIQCRTNYYGYQDEFVEPYFARQLERELSAITAERDALRAQLATAHAALAEIVRHPTKPWPDPGAHSAEACAIAIHATYCAMRFIAINALNAKEAAIRAANGKS